MARSIKTRKPAQRASQARPVVEPTTKTTGRRRGRRLGSLVLIALPCMLSLVVPTSISIERTRSRPADPATTSGETPRHPVELLAAVRLTSTQIAITNEDSVSWRNMFVGINAISHWGEAFILKSPRLDPGETLTAGVMDFTKFDGTRFNPLKIKLKTLSILCDLPAGKGRWSNADFGLRIADQQHHGFPLSRE